MTDPLSPVGSSAATVTAFFDNRDEALRAVDRLSAIGLPEDCLRLTEGRAGDAPPQETGSGGFLAALTDFFFPDDDRATYAEGLSRGGYLVTARNIPDGMHDTVIDVLDDEGAVDIDERAAAWRAEGWRGEDSRAEGTRSESGRADDRGRDDWSGVTAAQTGAQADILSGAGLGTAGGDVPSGTSGMAGMDTPHAGVTADRAGESRGTITPQDRSGDLWQRDMARGRPRVRTYSAVPPVPDPDDEDGDAIERDNLPS